MKNIRIGQKEINPFRWYWRNRHEWPCSSYETMGFKIQGSDQNKNKSTLNCSKAGIKVFIGHSKKI